MTTVIRGIVLWRLKFHQQTNEKSKKTISVPPAYTAGNLWRLFAFHCPQ